MAATLPIFGSAVKHILKNMPGFPLVFLDSGNYSVGMTRAELPDSDAYRAALAEEMRSILSRRRMPYKELADAFGWGKNKIGNLMNGQTRWDSLELINVCDYLSDHGAPVDVAEVLGAAKRRAYRRRATDVEDNDVEDTGAEDNADMTDTQTGT